MEGEEGWRERGEGRGWMEREGERVDGGRERCVVKKREELESPASMRTCSSRGIMMSSHSCSVFMEPESSITRTMSAASCVL